MAIHSSTLAWRIPRTEEAVRLWTRLNDFHFHGPFKDLTMMFETSN